MASDNKFAIRLVLIACAVVVLVVIIAQYNNKRSTIKRTAASAPSSSYNSIPTTTKERFENSLPIQHQPVVNNIPSVALKSPITAPSVSVVKPSEERSNEDYRAVDFETTNNMPSECFPRDRLTAEDLLPKDAANNKFAQANPAGQGDLKDQNFLTAGFHIGVNTIGQSLRNPNYQLRSDPPNPKMNVGPWNQTTIEYDQSRRFFEINDC